MNIFNIVSLIILLLITVKVCDSACPPGCSICNPPNCTICNSGYYLNIGASCSLCSTLYDSECTTCTPTSCLTCTVGYIVTTLNNAPWCQTCSSHMSNCLQCTSSTVCTGCQSGYALDTSNPGVCFTDCSTSITNCQTCASPSTCALCKPGYYLNSTNTGCISCNIVNCTTCFSNGTCSVCATGYWLDFSTSNMTCSPCFYKCITCENGPECLQCQPGYYLSNNSIQNRCLACQFPCIKCNVSSTNCTQCPPSQMYYLNTTSTGSCKYCSNPTLTNCLLCNSLGTMCTQCVSTLFYVNTTHQCTECQAPCQTCLNTTDCLTCMTDSHAVNSSSKMCELCSGLMPNCLTCLTQKVCLTCATNDTYFLAYPPTSCVLCRDVHPNCTTCQNGTNQGPVCIACDTHYFIQGIFCQICPAVCQNCSNLTNCLTCVNTTYAVNGAVNSQMCTLCRILMPNCVHCNSSTFCTNCTNRTISQSGSCANCSSVQYEDQPNQLCLPCVAPCQTCLNHDDCLTCTQFYEYIPAIKRCTDICGDSVVMTAQCDNNFGVLNDGCSDTCTEEDNYTCALHTETVSGQTVNKSICSYDLKVNITLAKIDKEPFKNTLTWTYTLTPYLYGLPGTTSRDFTQDELKKTFILYDIVYGPSAATMKKVHSSVSGLTVESIAFDASQSQVSVTFMYEKEIKNSEIELFIDFTYLKSTLNIPNFVTTQDSQKVILVSSYRSNSMIGQYYTEDQYSLASTLNKLALIIALLSFLAFIVGIFTKELVGLQMVMLCQFVYISLFYFEGTLELPLFALKSLLYSTGYNIPWTEVNYSLNTNNPPQSLTLGFDVRTFSHNFNLMALLYILPLLCVIPFIPLKAKCIRKLSMIELGHKWVDLLLGEIMLFIVLFNFQYFLMGLIVFYQDGRNLKDYMSSMTIVFGGLCTICSFLGLIFKPEIYGNFRTAFQFDTELRMEIFQNKNERLKQEQSLQDKFENNSLQSRCNHFSKILSIYINENYFWRNWRKLHTLLTYNHYFILIIYFTLVTLTLALIKDSSIIILSLSLIVLLDLILMRSYGRVSQKLRSVFFFVIYSVASFVRYYNNHVSKDEYNMTPVLVILGLLVVAVLWTYACLIKYFIDFLVDQMSNRNVTLDKVFNNQMCDNLDKANIEEEQQTLMRKLMKRYERVELQYNLFNARNQVLSVEDQTTDKVNDKKNQENHVTNRPQQAGENKKQNLLLAQQLIRKAEESNNFRNLKQQIEKQKKRKKKEDMKNKVSGNKMLNLLKLNNFTKYEQEFLMSNGEKQIRQQQNKQSQNQQSKSEKQDQNQIQKVEQQKSQHSIIDDLEEYKSTQPQNLQQAKQKLLEENVIIEQNQYLRYKRAMQIISSQGLDLDRDLIDKNYDKI